MEKIKPLFSIVVPVYNVQDDIERCIASLTDQTFQNIEIILVDDGSTDASGKICDRYAAGNQAIKVIHKINGGLSDARNAGLETAMGEYIIFVDADDYIDVDSCKRFVPYVTNSPDVAVGEAYLEGGYSRVQHADFPLGSVLSGKEYMKQSYRQKAMPPAVWLNVYKRSFLMQSKLSFKKGILHEDVEFTPRVFYQAKSVVITGQRFYHYVIRSGSIMNAKNKNQNFRDVYRTCLGLEKYFSEEYDAELRRMVMDDLLGSYLYRFKHVSCVSGVDDAVDRSFALRSAYCPRNRIKAFLFIVSPKAYYFIANHGVQG